MKRILIVEDGADNRMLLRAILCGSYEVTECANGADALAAVAANDPDVVLLDISLPGMDGVEVLRHLRADPFARDLPVIAFTAHASSGDRGKYLAHGFDDHITKPVIDETILLGSIAHLLEHVPA